MVLGLSAPDVGSCTRAECLATLFEGKDCPSKASSQMWGPIRWSTDARRKTLTNVVGVSALGVDIDHVPTDEALAAIVERVSEWTYLLHATHSDRPGDRCVRLVFAVSREMTPAESNRVRAVVVEFLELPADRRARDASRLYYAPNRPSDACGPEIDGSGYLFVSGGTRTLDVDALLAAAGPEVEVTYASSDFVIPDFDDAPTADAFEAAAQTLGKAWPDDDRHPAQLALAGALARAGWPVDLIAAFCARVAEIDDPGNPKHVRLAGPSARDSVSKVSRGDNVKGWPTLIEYVGEAAVAEAREALGFALLPVADPAFAGRMSSLAARAAEVVAVAEAENPSPAPIGIFFDASLKSAQRRLASRKDADSIRDAELLRRVARGEFLTDSPDASERETALALAAIAVVRAAPANTPADQVIRALVSSAGPLAADLPEVVALATEHAKNLSSLFARVGGAGPGGFGGAGSAAANDEFVLDTTGPRVGQPSAANKHNFDVAFRRFGVTLHFDRFGHKKIIEVADAAGRPTREIVQDHHVRDLMVRCEENFAFYPPKDKFYDVCDVIAHRNAYHPVLDYLDALEEWDGVNRVEEWLIRYAGVEDSPYVRAVSRLVLVAAVRRVRQPGCKFDEMLILEGAQGTLKSSALKALCPDPAWFTDDFKLGLDTKTQMERTLGKWIVEAGELKGMSASDQNDMKSNLSRSVDEARMAYGRETMVVPRQYVFIGTTNEGQYLRDPTGDRRYWPVTITQPFDLAGLLADRDQIWAEASHLDATHPESDYIRLAPELYAAATAEQQKRRTVEPIEVVLSDALDGATGRIRTQDVWKIVGNHEERLPTSSESRQIVAALRSLGFEHDRRVVGGVRGTYYARGTGPERNVPLTVVGSASAGFRVRVGAPAATAPSGPPPVGPLGPPRGN